MAMFALVRGRFAALLVIASGLCWAQFSGSIQGTIKDPASAVVPNAKVQLKNTQTNIVQIPRLITKVTTALSAWLLDRIRSLSMQRVSALPAWRSGSKPART